MSLLTGRVALVTGAAGGIGSETVLALAEAGARVMLTDLHEEPLEQLRAALAGKGHEVAAKTADITDEASVRALVADTVSRYGRIDILDNNAGATGFTDRDRNVTDMDAAVWDQVTAINARGPMLMCKHVIPVMVDGGGGSVINISSGQSLIGDLTNLAYASGKGAVNAMTRHMATAYGPSGVRVNAIAPGLIIHPGGEDRLPKVIADLFVANCLVPRLGRPRDIADTVVFLASDMSAYITGQVISVDGGILAHLATVAPMRELLAQGTSYREDAGTSTDEA
jgi:NAD(P)-dependent dehydrogenase (short-subunit alcohol dehydrogenase family)